jgi:hypothetical protein
VRERLRLPGCDPDEAQEWIARNLKAGGVGHRKISE